MQEAFRPVRLRLVQNGSYVATRFIAAQPAPAACRLQTGAHSLALMNLPDNWRPSTPWDPTVHTIDHAAIHSSAGIVALSNGEVIEDTFDHSDPLADGYQRRHGYELPTENGEARPEGGVVSMPPPQRHLAGRHLSLLMPGGGNPFHWLIMNLARVGLLDDADIAGLTAILVPAELGPVARDSLDRDARLPDLPRHEVARGIGVSVDSLVLPWRVASGDGMHPAGISHLRRLYPATGPRHRRLYIDRRGAPARALSNEGEIVDLLAARGFLPVRLETLTMGEQARLFQEAEIVVAPHGAGLANMVFAPPGLRIVELLPDGAINWCYRHLAAASGHRYDCVIGRSAPASHPGASRLRAGWTIAATHVLSGIDPDPATSAEF